MLNSTESLPDAFMNQPSLSQRERSIVFIVSAVQFVNILDFMIVMPLGPDFSRAIGVPTSMMGAVGGSYTLAAAVSGVVGSFFLDRFERRQAFTWLMLGLSVATALGGFAFDLKSLLGARVLAGLFGGPATSIAFAIVTDSVPPERRGKALGIVGSAFAVASVLGVPAGLELARHFDFRAPFFAVAALGLLVTVFARALLPEMRGHLVRVGQPSQGSFLSPSALAALSGMGLLMLGVFSIVPNIATFVQFNLGYPRELLGMLYLVGGVASFVAVRLVGIAVDRFGALSVFVVGTLLHAFALVFGFIHPIASVPILLVFSVFMVSGSSRMVPLQTLATRVPEPRARARFMSAQSAVQHFSSAAGAFMSSAFLRADASGRVIGLDRVASVALALALTAPFFIWFVERSLSTRDALARLTGATG